jgi:thiamine-phosphate pyrophosphorylase
MISTLHHITQEIPGISHAQLVLEACQAGVDWIQLRMKNTSYQEYKKEALEALKICRQHRVKLIINDNVELAKEVKADGVHIGKNDMSPIDARNILGADYIIGGTANAIEDIRFLHQAGVNYIGLGPFRFTTTKTNLSPVLGLEGYRDIIRICRNECLHLPIIAIGGILPEDVSAILETGINGVAVSSAINKASDKKDVVQKFLNQLTITQ